jgi:hypothetical protein
VRHCPRKRAMQSSLMADRIADNAPRIAAAYWIDHFRGR